MRRYDELRWTIAVTAIGLAVVAIYAWPGYMAYDSLDQLLQARSGHLTDWHPPIMSALWHVLDAIVAGPALVLVLQCSLFLAGLFVLLRRRFERKPAAIWTLAIFAFPPMLTMMAVIVKDALLAGALLTGAAMLTSPRRRVQLGACVPLAVAAALRWNAVAIVVPLVALLSPWPATRGPWLRALCGGAIAIALTGAGWLANRALTDEHTHPFHISVAPMDIVGTLHFAPELSDAEVRALLAGVTLPGEHLQARAHALYDPNRWWGSIIRGEGRLFDEPLTDEQRDAVARGWWTLVRTYPGAYLESRFDMMRELIGLTDVPFTPVTAAPHERSMLAANGQPPQDRNVVQKWLSRRMLWLGAHSIVFRPYLYLILAIGLAIVLRRDRLVIALLASAAANLAMLVIVSPSTDIRYVHWLELAVLVAVAIRFANRK